MTSTSAKALSWSLEFFKMEQVGHVNEASLSLRSYLYFRDRTRGGYLISPHFLVLVGLGIGQGVPRLYECDYYRKDL